MTQVLQALAIARSILGENHPNTQTIEKNLLTFLRTVIQNGQEDVLSDDPVTQELLEQLRSP
jgi:hypothetical protein